MALPHEFIAGDVARSQEVNDNFHYIMDILGQMSSPGQIVPLGSFLMGPRSNTLLTAAQDTGPADPNREFFQIGWNARWSFSGGQWRFSRYIEGRPATAIRIGSSGFRVVMTSATGGDLNAQMSKAVFAIRANQLQPNADFIFYPTDWVMQHHDGPARNIQDYRLTRVELANPVAIYNGSWLGTGTTVRKATDFGVPIHAKMIELAGQVTATTASGAALRLYQDRPSPSQRHGFIIHAYGGNAALFGRSGGQGSVPLGTGSRRGQFVINRTANFTQVYLYVRGYWI